MRQRDLITAAPWQPGERESTAANDAIHAAPTQVGDHRIERREIATYVRDGRDARTALAERETRT